MQLVDLLEDRADAVTIVNGDEGTHIVYGSMAHGDGWFVTLNGESYKIQQDAFENILKILKVPIIYIRRCVESGSDGARLAESTLNYWLQKNPPLKFMVEKLDEGTVVSQAFADKGSYFPSINLNDIIIDFFGPTCEVRDFSVVDDLFTATYTIKDYVKIGRKKFARGVRVVFSDCFRVPVRFDSVLYGDDGAVYSWPASGRKFRVASNNINQISSQIEEFLQYTMSLLDDVIVDKFVEFFESPQQDISGEKWLDFLHDTIRQNNKIKKVVWEACYSDGDTIPKLIPKVCKFVASPQDQINILEARAIQVAASNYIVAGAFK